MGVGRRTAKPKMTPKELRAIIEALGLKQGKFAEEIGTSRQSVVSYLSGDTQIPGPVAKFSRLLLTLHREGWKAE